MTPAHGGAGDRSGRFDARSHSFDLVSMSSNMGSVYGDHGDEASVDSADTGRLRVSSPAPKSERRWKVGGSPLCGWGCGAGAVPLPLRCNTWLSGALCWAAGVQGCCGCRFHVGQRRVECVLRPRVCSPWCRLRT